jgi:hypothetical protein
VTWLLLAAAAVVGVQVVSGRRALLLAAVYWTVHAQDRGRHSRFQVRMRIRAYGGRHVAAGFAPRHAAAVA